MNQQISPSLSTTTSKHNKPFVPKLLTAKRFVDTET
jgi:hypothetical protein